MYYFSFENGFQHRDLHAGRIPHHAVPLTEKQHHDLLEAQGRGCKIIIMNGRVVAQEPAPPSFEEVRQHYSRHTTVLVDTQARKMGYDDARDIMGFIDDPNPLYDKQAREFRVWRSQVWTEFDHRISMEPPSDMSLEAVKAWVAQLPAYPQQTQSQDMIAKE